MPDSVLVEMLHRELPHDRVVVDPDVLVGLSSDQAGLPPGGQPLAAVRPRSTDEVAQVLRVSDRLDVPVVVRGAGSGLSGGANAVPGCVVLSLERMSRIVEVDEVERFAVVEAGAINQAVKDAAAGVGLWYPPDPASAGFSTIGGNIATNAGGLCCLRYGVTSQYVMALTVVLADGRAVRVGQRTAKGVAGLDLTHLMVGSEGTLGVVTEATLRLRPPRGPAWTMAAAFPTMSACGAAVVALRRAGVVLGLLEVLDGTTLRTIDAWRPTGLDDADALLLAQVDRSGGSADDEPAVAAFRAAATSASAVDVMVAQDQAEADWLLDVRRVAYPAFERLGSVLLDDVCVPVAALPAFVTAIEAVARQQELVIGTFGHAGDGNLHPTIVVPPDAGRRVDDAFAAIVKVAQDLGGTCTGEHGVGLLKKSFLARELDPTALELMRGVKSVFDPRGRLNPGRALP